MPTPSGQRISTGIPGLDEIAYGGLLTERAYLVRGGPGSGKTTLSLHFLAAEPEGAGLYISLGENGGQVRSQAQQLDIPKEKNQFVDLSPSSDDLETESPYDLVPASDIELQPLITEICEAFETHRPKRIVLDSVSQMRYLSPDTFQFRRQILALLNHLCAQGATVLLTAEGGAEAPDEDLQFLSDGIIKLERMLEGRAISVTKFRGSGFADGVHFMRLTDRGMRVFPRLIPDETRVPCEPVALSTGVSEIDLLLGGGIERGTVSVISGPTGVGKTTLGMQIMRSAALRGERAVVYSFEEQPQILKHRCRNLDMPVDELLQQDQLHIETVEAISYSPDELSHSIRKEVESNNTRMVMLDSLSGYQISVGRLSVAGDNVVERLHALCRYLISRGVTVLILNEIASIAGNEVRATDSGISYLADTVIMLRYMEFDSELRKTIGVLKKRTSDFEKSLRGFDITPNGLNVGSPLKGLQGILHGQPQLAGSYQNPTPSEDQSS